MANKKKPAIRLKTSHLLAASGAFADIFRNRIHGVMLTNQKIDKFYLVNDRLCQLLRYQREKLLTFTAKDIFSPEILEDLLLTVKKEIKGKTHLARDINMMQKNGSHLCTQLGVFPLRIAGKKYVALIIRDITQEREINKMRTEFVSLTSHQLRTPLTAIRWYIEELYGGELGELTVKQKDYLAQVIDSNWRMIKLVNDLLNISRLETGRLRIDPKPTDLVALIRNTIKDHAVLARAKNCRLVFNLPSKKLPLINIDPTLIGPVINNIISNALKYSVGAKHKCGVVIDLTIKKSDLLITVSDRGIGIPKKDQPHIFEGFFRAANVSRLETEGTGLGLYLAKMIIEASGGKIWFQSRENVGSVFSVSLPLAGTQPRAGVVCFSELNRPRKSYNIYL